MRGSKHIDENRAGRKGAVGATVSAFLIDSVFVLTFAASGRSQHGEAETISGLWHTAWPFLAALVLIWIIATVWRAPFAVARSGLPVWLGTLTIGMLFRVLFTDGGAALPFVLVTASFLVVTIVGWRMLAALVRKLRSTVKREKRLVLE